MAKEQSTLKRNGLTLPVIVVFFAGALGIFATRKQEAGFTANSKVAAEKTVRISVQGMTCAVCAARVKKALQSVEGVREARIDLERREAWVRYDEGSVSPDKFVSAINDLGYKAGMPLSEVPR